MYFKNIELKRDSQAYINIIESAFLALFSQNNEFREAVRASKEFDLKHSLGKNDITLTVLTEDEFIEIIHKLQNIDLRSLVK